MPHGLGVAGVELEAPRVWLRLRLRLEPDGRLAVGVRDDRGVTVEPPAPGRSAPGWGSVPIRLPGWPALRRLDVLRPDALDELSVRAVESLPPARTGTPYPPSVPVHVTVPAEIGWLPAYRLVEPLLPAGRFVVVEDRAAGRGVAPFALPLNVVAVGAAGRAVLRDLEGTPWREPRLQAHLAAFEPVAGPADLPDHEIDVLVVDAVDAAALRRSRARVRLAIVLGTGDGGPLDAAGVRLPFARSVLTVKGPPGAGQPAAVRALFDALSHDLPLHEALRLVRDAAGPARGVTLSASPSSLHDLRLTSAWGMAERRLMELSGNVGHARPGELGLRVAELTADLRPDGLDLVGGVLAARRAQFDFGRERGGLLPLAEVGRDLGRALDALRRLPAGAAATVPEGAGRVVNLGLRRGPGTLAAPFTESTYVARTRSVVAGGRYDLDAQIGAAWPAGLVVGGQPAIELLLPDDRRGHDLDIVLFGDAVGIPGGNVRRLHLPPAGPSDVVTFGLVMPAEAGPAWLRVSVYHRDNLVETFVLQLLVEPAERELDRPVLTARLQHSATRDWGNLDALGERALSITLNADPAGAHRLFLKGPDAAVTLPVDERREEALIGDVRQALTALVDRPLDPAAALWRLARRGRALRQRLFLGADGPAQLAVSRLAESADQSIQIIRAQPDRAVPWSLVYDWPLPREIAGRRPPEVCLGRCDHTAADGRACVRGFWGIRHRVEELLAEPTQDDQADRVAAADPAALVALGVPDADSGGLVPLLTAALAPRHVLALDDTESLLDWLFRTDRPGVFAILGHHETRDIIGEPVGSRITLNSRDGWLLDDEITDRRLSAPAQPLPLALVLLLSCGSVAVGPTELTHFLSALAAARAAAIVGTECDVYSDLAAGFAAHLLAAMAAGTGTGTGFAHAVQLARQRLVIDQGDARALAFTALGPAGLRLAGA
ncbi:hypothetical protein [Dactylosporangium sp. CA-092794]|uniref:hypothetical protein n=1 Tax=Dactylosporangium sp. CA-092794 TaxID=3239929 RepID=UPI003D91A2AE